MMFYLVGARGRLGQAIAKEYGDCGIVSLDRSTYEDWTRPGAHDLVSRYFDGYSNNGGVIFVASGLLDPKMSHEALLRVNYHLPKNLIDGAAKLGIKIITFGTVLEGLLQQNNNYIQTKRALSEYINTVVGEDRLVIHLRMHTLYGIGQPSPFMFLGQMLASIRNNVPFKMTSGHQLREYHHFTDESKAIKQILNIVPCGVMNLSHGKPLRLRAIAESVFDALGKSDLLCVGSLPEPLEENYETVFNPLEFLHDLTFQESLPAIVNYISSMFHMSDSVGKAEK